ncbi:MAG TPA: TonB-dependent receptor [Chryseolinea sp.]|nr:TonB-dependent receptor [Chryseolinea sp.]
MKKSLLVLIILSLYLTVNGQGIIVGSVLDEDKASLAGAHIFLKETSTGTIANGNGQFRLKDIPKGTYTLSVSFIGYETLSQSVVVNDKSTSSLELVMKPGDIQLADLVVSASAEQPMNTLSPLDIKLRPTNTSQDILRMVPGLFIAQHAGGGKAEQIFLRGFDIDHGTDLNLEVDGLPVNMVSHAHGQGYSDLHFVIPEMINYVNFDKGPYFADKGDFTTAGFVDFQTKNVLEENFVKFEGAQFGTFRTVAGVNIFSPKTSNTQGYIGTEFFRTDGFVESPQDFNRFNITSKISTQLNDDNNIMVGASYFTSKWDASGQIPTRAVESGLITRFGSIDDSEGGQTSRANLFIKHTRSFSNGAYLTQQAYAVHYDFSLYSNFTFYLNDPINGDQINQNESRMIYGYKSSYVTNSRFLKKDLATEVGAGFRFDDINDISLSNTVRRTFINDIQRGYIQEANANAYISETLSLSDQWSLNAALRFDYFNFTYENRLDNSNKSMGKAIVSPKLNVNYQLNKNTRLYVRTGFGFHSNDARVVIQQTSKEILPKAYGVDFGLDAKLSNRLFLHAAIWGLDLDQEFVYVGDAGIVEPSGKTRRVGLDFSIRYELLPWLFLDGDLNFTNPSAKGEPEGHDYIPLAPTITSIGGLSFKMQNGFNGTLRYRYIGDRAANEDNSVVAEGYFLADAVVNYTKKKFEVGLSAENIFNIDWNEAQFDTESRLVGESQSVSEIHFTPGTPLFLKLKVSFFF